MLLSKVIRGIASAWKDLLLLILGIYLALWLENKVQDWQDLNRQNEYLYRVSLDLQSDATQLRDIQSRLEKKLTALQESVAVIAADDFTVANEEHEEWVIKTAGQINNYHFFTAQDFTFVSMRESGDFKLVKDEDIQRTLLSIYDDYKLLQRLQDNYIQGLDDHFIPLWLESVDIMRDKVVKPELVESSTFSNMVLFAVNETQTRLKYINRVLQSITESSEKLKRFSGKS